MKTNQDYKNASLAALQGNWVPAVLATLIYLLIAMFISGTNEVPAFTGKVASPFNWLTGVSALAMVFVMLPLQYGFSNAMRFLYERQDTALIENQFRIPLNHYFRSLGVMLLVAVKTFLWSLLLIIPGIIKSFAYSMAPFIAEDHPEYTVSQAISQSCRMMDGHKFDLFYLYLSFIGWFLLSILSCGIGFLWLQPYVENAVAAFYNDLKAQNGDGIKDATIIG